MFAGYMMVVAVVEDDEDDEPVETSATTNLSPVTKPAATRLLDHSKNVNKKHLLIISRTYSGE